MATTPDMTARWESVLDGISKREANYPGFMNSLTKSLDGLIVEAKANLPQGLEGVKSTKPKFRKKRKKA